MLLHITRPGAPPNAPSLRHQRRRGRRPGAPPDARPYRCPPERGKGPASAGRGFCPRQRDLYPSTCEGSPPDYHTNFNPRPLARGDPCSANREIWVWRFQSTPPLRGRPRRITIQLLSPPFQSTPPCGGDTR